MIEHALNFVIIIASHTMPHVIIIIILTVVVRVTPPSLLVLNDTEIELMCQSYQDFGSSSSIHWFMNRSKLFSPDLYHHDPDWENNVHKIEFNATVTASLNLNNTNFRCVIENDDGEFPSNDVLLVILTGELANNMISIGFRMA